MAMAALDLSAGREPTFLDEGLSDFDEARRVDREDGDRRPADRRFPNEDGAVPGEMLAPTIVPRVKQTHNFTGLRVLP